MSDPLEITIFDKLAEPFPLETTHWRVGHTTKDKKKGVALAYIDARDVMDRLDLVVGPENWRDEYFETPKRVFCTLSLRLSPMMAVREDGTATMADDGWIGKTDGAGDTSFEGEKGGISDAFKRAAVRWGIGRYLYSLSAPWIALDARGNIPKDAIKELNTELSKVIGEQTWGDRNHANMFRALKQCMEMLPPENLPEFIDKSEAYLRVLKVGYRREIEKAMNHISQRNQKKEAA